MQIGNGLARLVGATVAAAIVAGLVVGVGARPIPQGFLQPNAEYEWEVLAIEKGGNQTLSSDTFTTSR